MQDVCQLCSLVRGDIAAGCTQQGHLHGTQCLYDLVGSVVIPDLFLQKAIDKEADIAGHKVGFDTVISPDVYRVRFEFCFHDPKVFFDFPALPIDL